MVNAAQCHGKARERKGSAREEKGRAAEKERKKKMGMERMREFTLWRIFDFTNYKKSVLQLQYALVFLWRGLYNKGKNCKEELL